MKEKLSLPKGWEMRTVGDVCERGSSNVSQNQLDNEVGDYPIFGASGLIKNVSFYHQENPYLSIVKDGSGVGRVTKMDAYTSVIGTLQYILPKENIDLNYLYYNLISIDFKKYVAGAAIPHIYFKDYKNEPFLWMPLPEQQRIVAILDEALAAIAKAKANAEQNLKNAKELFESLLIKIFLEGINIKRWNLEKLEKYNKVVVGYVVPISKEYTNDENGVLLLSTKNIGDKGVSLEKLTRINHQFHNKNKKSQLLPGDILVARHGNSGQSAVIPNEIKIAHALNVIVIKKSETLSSEYICFLLNSGVLDKIAASKGGSVQEIINTSVIKDLTIPVPTVKEQQAIVQKLDTLSTETKKLEVIYQQKIDDLEELKKSVLQKAFSGELKTAKSRRDVNTIENKINQPQPNPEGVT